MRCQSHLSEQRVHPVDGQHEVGGGALQPPVPAAVQPDVSAHAADAAQAADAAAAAADGGLGLCERPRVYGRGERLGDAVLDVVDAPGAVRGQHGQQAQDQVLDVSEITMESDY